MDKKPPSSPHVFTVSELNSITSELIKNHFSTIWLEGEISNFSRPHSGHWYFSLKDEYAQIRCAMFRMFNRELKFIPENGMHVLVRATAGIYKDRGDFQLIVEHLEEMGFGAMQRAFEQLKAKLSKAELFADDKKKPLPSFPKTIGVITSKTGAAIQDILNVLNRRAPSIDVIIYPSLIQGEQAAKQIVSAIKDANLHGKCDALILARGGGSIEDLWPFNEEAVAYAIFASEIPIVTGVGHETDFTIADFVSDYRAPTPSAAAELVSYNYKEILTTLEHYHHRLLQALLEKTSKKNLILNELFKRIQRCHPLQKLNSQAQRLDMLEKNLFSAQLRVLEKKNSHLTSLYMKLQRYNPIQNLRQNKQRLQNSSKQLIQSMNQLLINKTQKLQLLARTLHNLSPLATLKRGYSITTNQEGKILKDAAQTKPGENINIKLHRGKLNCKVNKIQP